MPNLRFWLTLPLDLALLAGCLWLLSGQPFRSDLDYASAFATSVNAGTVTFEASLKALESHSQMERYLAVTALEHFPQYRDQITPLLIAALHDDYDVVRMWAAKLLSRPAFIDRQAVSTLIELLDDPAYFVRYSAARTLGAIGDQRAYSPLLARNQDEAMEYVRIQVKQALNKLSRPAL